MSFYLFFGKQIPTKIDYRKQVGSLILTSLLEELEVYLEQGVNLLLGLLSPDFCWLSGHRLFGCQVKELKKWLKQCTSEIVVDFLGNSY